jgi:putative salt-induced outer membrane protein YdiY
MQIFFLPIFLFLACLLHFLVIPTLADEIILENGDRITGEILTKDDGTVSVKTSYAGTIKIDWQQVKSIETESPVEVMFVDKEIKEVTSFFPEDEVEKSKENNAAPIEEVKYINPAPHITGKGISWRARVNTGVTIRDGNTDNERARLDGEIVARTEKRRYTAASTLNYATEDGVETESNISGLFKLDHFISQKWYLTGHLKLLDDKYKDLNLRTIAGAGAGYQFRESRLLNLSVEAGIDYVHEDFIVADDNEYPAARWSFNYDQYLFREAIQVFHNHTLNIGLKDTEDIILETKTGVRVPIISNLNANFEVDVEWDNSPGEDKKRTDAIYIFGLGYTF